MTDTCSRGCKSGYDDFFAAFFWIVLVFGVFKLWRKYRALKNVPTANPVLNQQAIGFQEIGFNAT